MNILQIVPELRCGGVETGTLDIARYLVKTGHGAFVISAGGPMVKTLELYGAIHTQLPVNEKSPISVLQLIGQVSKIIQKYNIDIVHARSRVPAWIGYFAARRTGRVFLTTCHGY
ncbi:MAG: glycosyltransferase, partial [Candidatus Omnitrophota bacterium]